MENLEPDSASFDEFARLDNAFHAEIIRSVGHSNFSNLLTHQQLGLIDAPENPMSKMSIHISKFPYHHRNILNAILAGDPCAAYAAIWNHGNAAYASYHPIIGTAEWTDATNLRDYSAKHVKKHPLRVNLGAGVCSFPVFIKNQFYTNLKIPLVIIPIA